MDDAKDSSRCYKVSFGSAVIYEFLVVIGDSPSCSVGCPVALGGFHHISSELVKIRLDDPPDRKKNLIIPVDDRARLLYNNGFSLEEIVRGASESLRLKELREESLIPTKTENVVTFFRKKIPTSKRRTSPLTLTPSSNFQMPNQITTQAKTA